MMSSLHGAVDTCLAFLFLCTCIFCSEGQLAAHLLSTCDAVTVDMSADQAILPCHLLNFSDKATVRWSLAGNPDKAIATLQSDGTIRIEPEYKDRAMMPKYTTNTSDRNVSLVLKQIKKDDTGRYKIKVTTYGIAGTDFDKSVDLFVNDTVVNFVKAKEGDKHVILPCNTTQETPEIDCIATWMKPEPGTRGLCILQRGSEGINKFCSDTYKDRVSIGDQVSMVLASPKVDDTGNYSCAIKRGQCFRVTSFVYLTVEERSMDAMYIIIAVVLIALLIGAVLAAVLVLYRKQRGCFGGKKVKQPDIVQETEKLNTSERDHHGVDRTKDTDDVVSNSL